MSCFGYDLPSRPCLSDGNFAPDSGHSEPNVRIRSDSFRSTFKFGRGRRPWPTVQVDPTQTWQCEEIAPHGLSRMGSAE
jgi:hypothetical protein